MADQFSSNGWYIRLSPSGPRITDPDSGGPLTFGPGSTGIIIRAQGTSGTSIPAPSGGEAAVTGLDNVPVYMPKGFHYDIQCHTSFTAPAGEDTDNDGMRIVVEYSDDNGGSWQRFPLAGSPSTVPRMYGTLQTKGGNCQIAQEIDVDCTGFASDITNLRVKVSSDSGAVYVAPGHTVLRVEQYIPNPVPSPPNGGPL
jgi:hypothetical protein